jgi:hypothetical protein
LAISNYTKQINLSDPLSIGGNSPGYKLAIYVARLLKQIMRLPNAFNVQNSIRLMNSLQQIDVLPNIKICSFDIKNMYTSIPINDLINIIHRSLTYNNLPDEYKHEIITVTKLTTIL